MLCGDTHLNPGPPADHVTKNLNFCHTNIRGANRFNLTDLETWLCEKFDIITISETFWKDNQNSATPRNREVNGFNFFHKD